MIFVFLCLTSLRIAVSGSIHAASDGTVLFFLWLRVVFHCAMCITSSSSVPLADGCLGVVSRPGYCKQCCSEHWGAHVCMNYGFSGYMPVYMSMVVRLGLEFKALSLLDSMRVSIRIHF